MQILEQRQLVVRNVPYEGEEEVREGLILRQLLNHITPVDGCKSCGFFGLHRKTQMREQALFDSIDKQRT